MCLYACPAGPSAAAWRQPARLRALPPFVPTCNMLMHTPPAYSNRAATWGEGMGGAHQAHPWAYRNSDSPEDVALGSLERWFYHHHQVFLCFFGTVPRFRPSIFPSSLPSISCYNRGNLKYRKAFGLERPQRIGGRGLYICLQKSLTFKINSHFFVASNDFRGHPI